MIARRTWAWNWAVASNGDADGRIFTAGADTIGLHHCVAVSPRYQKREQWEADAKLLAAAPDLLSALTELLADIERWGSKPISREALNDARAAITRATGKVTRD